MVLEGIAIYKMTGSGNDFVFVDGRSDPVEFWTRERVRAVCSRGTGVGADGFVVLTPGSGGGAVRFVYFNADGGRSALCGNAALCAVRLAAWLEFASPTGVILETDSGPIRGRCIPGEVERAEIELPESSPVITPEIPLATGERRMGLTTVGVPHLVVLVDDVATVAVAERGRVLRHHPGVGTQGANVDFVGNGDGHWRMRTYERGVEAETLACGTGAVATTAALAAMAAVSLPLDLETTSGSVLTVAATISPDGSLLGPRLTGEARLVFRALLGRASGCPG